MGGRGATYINCKRMAINALVEQMCEEEEEEGVGFKDLWGYFVGKEDMYVRDGLHLNGNGAAYSMRTCFDLWRVEQDAIIYTRFVWGIHREAKYAKHR